MIRSIRHATSNENGREELSIDRDLSTFEYLTAAAKACSFKIPTSITEVWEMRGDQWVDKATGDIPDHEKQIQIFYARHNVRMESLWEKTQWHS